MSVVCATLAPSLGTNLNCRIANFSVKATFPAEFFEVAGSFRIIQISTFTSGL